MARPEKIRLGDLLVREGLISATVLEAALVEQKQTGRRLGRVLINSGVVTEAALAQGLAHQLGLPFIDLKQSPIDGEALKELPEGPARRLRVIPLKMTVRLQERGLVVGMADPGDLFAYDELVRITQQEIHIAVVTESDLLTAYDRFYRRTDEISGFTKELEDSLKDGDALLDALSADVGSPDAPVVWLIPAGVRGCTAGRLHGANSNPR